MRAKSGTCNRARYHEPSRLSSRASAVQARVPQLRGADARDLAAFAIRRWRLRACRLWVGGPASRGGPALVAGAAIGTDWLWQLALLIAILLCGQWASHQP